MGVSAADWRKFVLRWMAVSLLFHLVTSVFSVGYHSADEFFQITEWVSFKLGRTPLSVLAVEFPERMRPWMQPFIYWCMTKGFLFAGIRNPFTWAMGYRLFAGIVGWLSALSLAFCVPYWFSGERARRFAVYALSLIWFFPVLHARPSSESLGGSFFVLGAAVGFLLSRTWREKKHAWLGWVFAGALFGMSFESRFQMGLMIVGAFFWFALIGKTELRNLTALVAGGAAVFVLGRVVDHWGYGEWVLSPWRYFSYNLIRNEVNRFGQAPWWDLFRMSLTESWPPLGLLLVISAIVAWIRFPKHLLTWSQVPFFLVHELIPHKEFRFFFPIASAVPILLVLSLSARASDGAGDLFRLTIQGWRARLVKVFVGFLIFDNFVALLALSFVPFSRNVVFYEELWKRAEKGGMRTLYTPDRDPFEVLGTDTFFYRPERLVVRRFKRYSDLPKEIAAGSGIWLFHDRFDLPAEASSIQSRCKPEFRTVSPFVKEHLNFWHWMERSNVWTLYSCR